MNSDELLAHAELVAQRSNQRFTAIRRQVYKCLTEADKPVGAYDILENLNGVGAPLPPTVYRALEWLLELGLIRKIASISKYVALPQGQSFDTVAILVCRSCNKTEVIDPGTSFHPIAAAANSSGFSDLETTLEIIGQCGGSAA